MKDRAILLSLAIVGLLAAFYFMVLSPKRESASQLGEDITQLEASIDEQEQVASFAEQARHDFPRYYGRMVVLGKAVPDQADQASMLVQLSQIGNRSGVEFRSIKVAEGGAAATTATAPTSPATTTPPAGGEGTTSETGTTSTPSDGTATTPSDGSTPPAAGSTTGGGTPTAASTGPAPATEATAASLPIGATVGAAGLPILPYDLIFLGSFFDIADFMSGVDSLIQLREGSGQVVADGRLLTVDGFSLKPIPTLGGEQRLKATFAVTSYVVPSDEGLTAGASPTAPGAPQVTPTSTTTPTVTP